MNLRIGVLSDDQRAAPASAKPASQAGIRWKLAGEPDWRDGDLVSRADYDARRLHLVDLVDGHWPAKRTLAVERQSSHYFREGAEETAERIKERLERMGLAVYGPWIVDPETH